ncbi:MAG: hypothetical protein IKO52_05720 [Clostridia bacterium]|nr:hypothetical protein [Clostridia bacterium]
MRKLRMLAGVLSLLLVLGMAGGALGEYRRTGEGKSALWGVMYKDALLLAKADGEMPEDETEVVFIWPLWDWLMRFLGIQ